jgi:uncharacterized surface protein with fasciclin (FAS1) repeats
MKHHTKKFTLGLAAVATAAVAFAAGDALADYGNKDKKDNLSYGEKSEKKDIVATAKAAGQFNTLATALTEANLVETLQGDGPFTVFAPTDKAFEALPSGQLETLLQPENNELLRGILLYHVASGEKMASDVVGMNEIETVQGESLRITQRDGKVYLNDNIEIIKTDIKASNGVIHVIDTVAVPTGGQDDEMEDDMSM